jgi:FAD/FMN-containing dehydrogenase/Fe-S oxidoreductase
LWEPYKVTRVDWNEVVVIWATAVDRRSGLDCENDRVRASPVAELLAHLDPETAGCIDTSALARALYSSDASLYRVVPQAVARPRHADELRAVVAAALAVGLPITSRGAGTSCAGNAVGPGLILDLGRHLTAIHHIDPEARTAEIDPGVVQARLQAAARPYGLRFGPDPSTGSRCTVGGMVGNNACGPRALGYGTTASNVVDAVILTGHGDEVQLSAAGGRIGARGATAPLSTSTGRLKRGLDTLVDSHLGVIRTEFGRFSRQVSGYGLEHLLPERGRDVAGFFAGSEGTLGIATRLTVRLVSDPAQTLLIALGYPSMAEAADAMPDVLPCHPTACEGLDRRLVDVVRRRLGTGAVPDLPRGDGWLLVELAGDEEAELRSRAARLISAAGALDSWIVEAADAVRRLWAIRTDAAGLAAVSLDRPAHAGWEDAAVPPEHLGAYLRNFEDLLAAHDVHGLPYGHFGSGCVHVRIDFPLSRPGGPERYREFVEAAARLVAGYGGSLSGEHGDGRARSALLPAMYSPAALDLFAGVKHLFDPDNLLNPGVLVAPRPVEADLRWAAWGGRELPGAPTRWPGLTRRQRPSAAARSPEGFAAAVHRCTGVGKCVAAGAAGLMCPSWRATREEQDSTRGRAHVLQEMVNGHLVTGGWRAPEVRAALDLCLGCKGCSRDCPTGTDIAWAKSEVLWQMYRGRPRPRTHYTLGWLPRWGRLIGRLHLGRLVNQALAVGPLARLARRAAGVDPRRPLPRFATSEPTPWITPPDDPVPSDSPPALGDSGASDRIVYIWADSFSTSFAGLTTQATATVLTAAGYTPRPLPPGVCCGLTWITTGQLAAAARHLRHALGILTPIVDAGHPIIGLEPSCIAVWRSDAARLLDDPRVERVAHGLHTLAELLTSSVHWTPPDLSDRTVIAQPHCHHAAVLGWQTDAALLARTGATVLTLNGCCGLAGNFGVEQGHYEASVAVAETELLPTLRAHPNAIVLADGFSCRKQITDLTARQPIALAELLSGRAIRSGD